VQEGIKAAAKKLVKGDQLAADGTINGLFTGLRRPGAVTI
jgi:hypothetical protein